MTKEDLLKQIDEYEVVVNGKVSQVAFAYPPTPDFRSGGVVPGSTDLDMMQRPLGPEIVMPRARLGGTAMFEHAHVRVGSGETIPLSLLNEMDKLAMHKISEFGVSASDAADALAQAMMFSMRDKVENELFDTAPPLLPLIPPTA